MLAEPCGTTAEPHTPYKGSATGSVPRAAPLTGQGHFDHDLPHFTSATASIIAAAWTASRDHADPQPIRQHWRQNPALRGLIAELMRGDA